MSAAYAVIYDVVGDEDVVAENFYEVFDTPQEAARVFRDAFPRSNTSISNPRLVQILGPIDNFTEEDH